MRRVHIMSLVALSLGLVAGKCGKSSDPPADAAGLGISCYVADMYRCDEAPAATTVQRANLPVMCSSLSGTFADPAACPNTSAFRGRCTLTAAESGMDGPLVQRFYAGADVAYAQDFCVNTSHGVWSTTF